MPALIPSFTDFARVQGAAYFNNKTNLINDAGRTGYLLPHILKGKDMKRVLKGGSQLKGIAILSNQSTASCVGPNVTVASLQNPQVTTGWTAEWRFLLDYMTWTDQETELQATSLETATTMYADLYNIKQQRLWTSMLHKIEDGFFRTPNEDTMESSSADPGEMYSIPCGVNEQTNGIANSVTTAANSGAAFGTFQGINQTNESRWRCNQVKYNKITPTASVSTVGDIPLSIALRKAWQLTRFQSPGTRDEYFTNSDMYGQMIVCSYAGERIVEGYMQLKNDHFNWNQPAGGLDMAVGKMWFHGVPFVSVPSLDEALLYSKAGATTSVAKEGAEGVTNEADKAGPRFYFLNGNFMDFVLHSNREFKVHDPMKSPFQPMNTVQYVDVWCNLVFSSLVRQAIVYPDADIWS